MNFKKGAWLLMLVMVVALSSAMAVSAEDASQSQNFGLFSMDVPDNVDFQMMQKYNGEGIKYFYFVNFNESSWDNITGFDAWFVDDFAKIGEMDEVYKLINETNDTQTYEDGNGTYCYVRDIEPAASFAVFGNDLDAITDMANSIELVEANSFVELAQDEMDGVLSDLNATSLEV